MDKPEAAITKKREYATATVPHEICSLSMTARRDTWYLNGAILPDTTITSIVRSTRKNPGDKQLTKCAHG